MVVLKQVLQCVSMPETFSILFVTLFAVVLLGAYTFRGVTGFGSGLIAIPLLALVLPLTFVVPFVSFLDVFASLVHGWRHRRHTAWRELLPVLPATVLGVVFALYLLKSVDTATLVHALGVFILLFAVYNLIGPEIRRHCSRKWAMLAGSIGGIVSTLFGTGGPLYVIYYQMRGLSKSVFRSTVATAFLVEGGIRLSGYALAGFYTREILFWIAVSLPLLALGLYIGGHIHTSISQRQFRRAIGVLLLASGFALLTK